MPLEFEAKVACLDFIPDPQKRVEIARKTENPPRFSNLPWFIELFRGCTTEDGWLDPQKMRALVASELIPRRFGQSASSYIKIVEQHKLFSTPQLFLPVDLESKLLLPPHKTVHIDGVRSLLRSRDFAGTVARLLGTSFPQDGLGLLSAKEILELALGNHSMRLAVTADNLR